MHSNVELASSELNSKVGVLSLVRSSCAGPASMVVSGDAVSTVKVRDAGVASVLPASSVARTSKVCWPSLSEGDAGELQGVKSSVSTRHSKVELASLELNSKVGVESLVRGPGS